MNYAQALRKAADLGITQAFGQSLVLETDVAAEGRKPFARTHRGVGIVAVCALTAIDAIDEGGWSGLGSSPANDRYLNNFTMLGDCPVWPCPSESRRFRFCTETELVIHLNDDHHLDFRAIADALDAWELKDPKEAPGAEEVAVESPKPARNSILIKLRKLSPLKWK